MFDLARERRRGKRMLRELPVERVRVKAAAPLPPLKLPENWLTQQRLLKIDRILTTLLLVLTGALLVLVIADTAQAEEQPVTMYVTVSSGSWLNGRLEPDAHSDVEARFQAGDTVDVYEVSSGWAKVGGGESGFVWCDIRYLSKAAPGEAPETCRVSASGRVRVREAPDGALVRWLNNGDTVTVQCRIDGWAYIGDGYVLETYLQPTESEPALEREPADEP